MTTGILLTTDKEKTMEAALIAISEALKGSYWLAREFLINRGLNDPAYADTSLLLRVAEVALGKDKDRE